MVKGQGNTSQSALRTQSWGIHFLQEILLKVQISLNMPWNLNVSAVKVKAYLCSTFFPCKGRISMQFFYSYYSFRRVGCNQQRKQDLDICIVKHNLKEYFSKYLLHLIQVTESRKYDISITYLDYFFMSFKYEALFNNTVYIKKKNSKNTSSALHYIQWFFFFIFYRFFQILF